MFLRYAVFLYNSRLKIMLGIERTEKKQRKKRVNRTWCITYRYIDIYEHCKFSYLYIYNNYRYS